MINPLPRELHRGMSGIDVLMVKRALARAKYRKWGYSFTKSFGDALVHDIKRFQKDHGLKVDGVYGEATHKKLAPYFDAYGANEMVKLWRTVAQESPIDIAVKTNITAHNYASQNAYTQGYARMHIVRDRIKPLASLIAFFKRNRILYEDCSSFQTGAAYVAGMPDPNGFYYNGQGYTGTLAVKGQRVWPPKKGDLVFYGSRWPYHHVARALEDGTPANHNNPLVGSHGRPGFDIERANYRGDLNHWRRYA